MRLLSRCRRWVGACAAVAVSAGLVAVPAVPAQAVSETVVVSEVYGGGGNAGAELTQDFVELANLGDAPVELDGWSVQYASAGGAAWSGRTQLTGTIEPGGFYLVAQARGSGGTTALPEPDASGTVAMSASQGSVALVNSAEALTCGDPTSCAADGRVVDLVGYGAARRYEGTPAPELSNTRSAARGADLASVADTDDNAADFAAGAPTPVNAAGEGPGGGEPGGPEEPGEHRVHDVTGTTRVSPLLGERVEGVPGVVTAVNRFGSGRGFWFQDVRGDGDERTSEGLFVFTGESTPQVAVGDEVLVSGQVSAYRPGAANGPNQAITQLGGAVWTVLSSGNALPEAEAIGPDEVPAELAPEAGGDISALPLEPDRYALDYWASRLGMRVSVADVPLVGPSTEFNELWVTTRPEEVATPAGGVHYGSYDRPNTGRLKIESLIPFGERPFPQADTGDRLTGTTAGPLYYDSFGGYTLMATELGQVADGGLTRDVASAQPEWALSVATYNVENLSVNDDAAKFERLAEGLVTHLAAPDIVALEEIQDDTGPTDDGVVGSERTVARFLDAIEAAGGPRYASAWIDPQDGQDGGQPGGNIRNVFLYDPAQVDLVSAPGGDATTPVEVVAGRRGAALSVSPGRIAPADAAWDSSRKPLVAQFRYRGRDVFVVANHFASKGGDEPLHGRFQPPERSSEVQRLAQAELVRGFVDELLAADPDANVLVVGDLNDFPFSPVLQTFTGDGAMVNSADTLPVEERYNYVFDGNSQQLDHILVGGALAHRVDFDVVHLNADFHDQVSDHDPLLLRFRPLSGHPGLDRTEDRRYYGCEGGAAAAPCPAG
ncbi:lamin tail domain-containing protein [Allonocardiopsis opalescens]|uniref:LTD domain-containing protein n=1 Tax=Allonocardiopsis opalescens TaxID=1144618 RepID=A0A2T0Q2F7_9ACTN|nr:lamin tail domain-containing protein [Allonocardiopsis opalescens]PRX97848.1 hypothetical protein CLV72_105198 [Allonocardiopsis opalescens]